MAASKPKRYTAEKSENERTIIMTYLPDATTEAELHLLLDRKVWSVEHLNLVYHKEGVHRGFAFVKFAQPEDVDRAVKAFDGIRFLDKKLKVAVARPQDDDHRQCNVYVRKIPFNWDEDTLRDAFGKFGEVVNVRLVRGDEQDRNQKTHAGFVLFATHRSAVEAIASASRDSEVFGEEGIRLDVKFAEDPRKLRTWQC